MLRDDLVVRGLTDKRTSVLFLRLILQLTAVYNSCSRRAGALFWPPQEPDCHRQAVYIYKIKIDCFFQKKKATNTSTHVYPTESSLIGVACRNVDEGLLTGIKAAYVNLHHWKRDWNLQTSQILKYFRKERDRMYLMSHTLCYLMRSVRSPPLQ